MEGRLISAVQNIKRGVENHRRVQVLFEIFAREKVEQFVFLPGSPHPAAEKFAGVGVVLTTGKLRVSGRLVAKVAEQFAMKVIRAGLCDHIHGAGRGQPGREWKQRLADAQLLNRASRQIGSGSAHGFVRDVQAINLHPGGAAIAADDGGRGKPALGWRQHLGVEHLHSWFDSGQIQEIAIGGNLIDLAGVD